ncbi:hypothetical protein JHK84_027381 [Glycine max]|nr:hypothetical protein JHK84_027381 [Glycine max]
MKKFFPVLSRDKATSSVNLEASETQHPSESIKETSFIHSSLSTGFSPPPVRPSASIPIIFLDVPSHRMNQLNYMSFIPTLGLFRCQNLKK